MIPEASTDREIARCHAVLSQLRPHVPEAHFVALVRCQRTRGYRLTYLEADGVISSFHYRLASS